MVKLESAAVGDAVRTLSEAFFLDDFVSRLCPDEGRRLRSIEPVFRFTANMAVHYGEAWADSDQMRAVALWQVSWRMSCPPWRWLLFGGLDIRRRLGAVAYAELTRVSARIDETRDRLAPDRYLYLSSLGVLPDHRREGLARDLVQPRVRQAAAEGLSSIVETNSDGALAFYRDAGFLVRAQFTAAGLQYTVLEYPARRVDR